MSKYRGVSCRERSNTSGNAIRKRREDLTSDPSGTSAVPAVGKSEPGSTSLSAEFARTDSISTVPHGGCREPWSMLT